MKTLAALLALALALAPAVPAVACDHAAPVALAAPTCACHGSDAFAASSVQAYAAPVVQLAPVVQSYQAATVALPTVTHSYAATAFSSRFNAYAAASSSHNAFAFSGHGHNVAFKRGFVSARNNDLDRAVNRAINRNLAARRQILRQATPRPSRFGRPPLRREGIITRGLRAPGRILGGLFGR